MLVHIENLVKRYGDLLALDHLSLDIEEGEIFGLLGPNGSGKTTAINCLLALLKYDKGTITIEAVALTKNNLADIRSLSHVFDLSYQDQTMILRCSGAKHNLIRVLNYLQEQDIPFGRVFSELPTLNDVFLEITGKELRD